MYTVTTLTDIMLVNVALNDTFATDADPDVLAPPPEIVRTGLPAYPLPPFPNEIVSNVPCPVVAPTVAPLPEVIKTEGAEVYPVPPAVTLTDVTTPPETTAVAVAPEPPPPDKTTFGATVNPLPPAVTFTAVTMPPEIVAVPVAPLPTDVNVAPMLLAPK